MKPIELLTKDKTAIILNLDKVKWIKKTSETLTSLYFEKDHAITVQKPFNEIKAIIFEQ